MPIARPSPYCSARCRARAKERRRRLRRPGRRDGQGRAWASVDTEGHDGRPTLLVFGRAVLQRRGEPLRTSEVLRFLVEHADRFHIPVIFAGTYDLNVWLWEWPRELVARLAVEPAVRGPWRVEWVPRHHVTVTYKPAGYDDRRRSVTVWDVWGFFQSSLVQAAKDWHCSVPAEVVLGKQQRARLVEWDPATVEAYALREAGVLVELMDGLRAACREVGLHPARWGGPGSVAAEWLAALGLDAALRDRAPAEVHEAAACAYFGGRVDLAAWGRWGNEAAPLWQYDVNSAYPDAARSCPDLSRLRWVHGEGDPDDWTAEEFALVRVRWSAPRARLTEPREAPTWRPCPWRTRRGRILWPSQGEAWLWWPEVLAALEWGLDVQLVEWWRAVGPRIEPLRAPIEQLAAARLALKAAGHPGAKAARLVLNSLYGKFAQRKARGDRPPRFRSWLWAGWVTSCCRAKLSRALAAHGAHVLVALTDSLLATRPLPLAVGPALGQWSRRSWSSAALLGAGVSRLRDEQRGEVEDKVRGFGRAAAIDLDAMADRWAADAGPAWAAVHAGRRTVGELLEEHTEAYTVSTFVGATLAEHAPHVYGPHWRAFLDVPRRLEPVWLVGTTKRLGAADRYLPTRERGQCPEVGDQLLSAPYDEALASLGEAYNREERLMMDALEAPDRPGG